MKDIKKVLKLDDDSQFCIFVFKNHVASPCTVLQFVKEHYLKKDILDSDILYEEARQGRFSDLKIVQKLLETKQSWNIGIPADKRISNLEKLLKATVEENNVLLSQLPEKDTQISEYLKALKLKEEQVGALADENEGLREEVKELKENTITVTSKGQLKRIYCQMGIEYVPKDEVARLRGVDVEELKEIISVWFDNFICSFADAQQKQIYENECKPNCAEAIAKQLWEAAETKRFLTVGKACKSCGFKTAQTEKYQGYCFQCACEKGIAQNPFDK